MVWTLDQHWRHLLDLAASIGTQHRCIAVHITASTLRSLTRGEAPAARLIDSNHVAPGTFAAWSDVNLGRWLAQRHSDERRTNHMHANQLGYGKAF